MRGKDYTDVTNNLYKGGWKCSDSEAGWSRFYKCHIQTGTMQILEISYDSSDIITGVYKTSY